MVHHADKRLRPIPTVFEGDRELGLVVLWVVHAVGLHGDVGAVGGGAAGGLETGCCGCSEEEGEERPHFEMRAGGVSDREDGRSVRCYLLV